MPSTVSLIDRLKNDFPLTKFVGGDNFEWSPENNSITFDKSSVDAEAQVLHELSHSILSHKSYDRDIELIGLERDAWEYAKVELAPRYDVVIAADLITLSLDTYRDWLHARSTCPNCGATGFEIEKSIYHCVGCKQRWRVNEARLCALRRYKTKK